MPCDQDNDNPPYSHDLVGDITITYNDTDGWSSDACPWQCQIDFDLFNGSSECRLVRFGVGKWHSQYGSWTQTTLGQWQTANIQDAFIRQYNYYPGIDNLEPGFDIDDCGFCTETNLLTFANDMVVPYTTAGDYYCEPNLNETVLHFGLLPDLGRATYQGPPLAADYFATHPPSAGDVCESTHPAFFLNLPTIIYYEGFENGNLDDLVLDGDQFQVSTDTQAGAGNYSGMYVGGSAHYSGVHKSWSSGITPQYVSYRIKTDTDTLARGYFVLHDEDNATDYDGVIFLYMIGGVFRNYKANGESNIEIPFSPNTWYHIEFKNIDYAAGTYDWYIDGAFIAAADFRDPTATSIKRMSLYNLQEGDYVSNWDEIIFATGLVPAPLNVALETEPDSCLLDPGETAEDLFNLLTDRGHNPVLVTGTDIDTLAEIQAFDVVVLPGPGCSCVSQDYPTFDSVVQQYIDGGGGIVASSWTIYSNKLDGAPNIEAVLPVVRNNSFINGDTTAIPVGSHPISEGLSSFTSEEYTPRGGGAKDGATVFLQAGGYDIGEAWEVNAGRAVYLGPLYFECQTSYINESLLDGSQPDAVEMVLRAIEWAGKQR